MRYVAFLRAINVGSRIVKMERLRALFDGAGFSDVATFIASGNVIFDSSLTSARAEQQIEAMLADALGYEVVTMVRSVGDVHAVVSHVRRRRLGPETGITLYVGFLKARPSAPAVRAITSLSNDIDRLSVHRREFYWRCAKPLSESTLTGPHLEKGLALRATVRNFNTVARIAERFGGLSR